MLLRKGWPAARAAALLLLAAIAAACSDPSSGVLPEEGQLAPAGPALAVSSSPCKSTGPSLSDDLNYYGRVLYDADESTTLACVDSAALVMTARINTTLNAEPWRFGKNCPIGNPGCGFNAGAYVALIFAAADRITTRGGMTAALDSALRRVEGAYVFNDIADGCTLQSTDNCMDGYSVAASGYGWIAAYRYLRGDPAAAIDDARKNTRDYVELTMNAACLFTGYGQLQLCNGTPAQLRAGTATTLSLNIGQQYPAYGFGLMTSVAAGVLGYDVSGASFTFTEDQKSIARALFAEAQGTIDAGPDPDVFRNNCPWISRDASNRWKVDSLNAPCGGKGGDYRPQMYALNAFYSQRIGSIPQGAYMSTVFTSGHFPKESNPNGFFSWGRYETYGKLGYEWFVTPRPHQRFVDAYTPQGWADGIDAGGYLRGWACDRDIPSGSVRVTVKAPGKTAITRRADLASEQGIANQCGGGYAHRYGIRLPADWTGLTVSVTVVDYFGFRSASLGCTQCVVPSTTVEWLQPSGVSWGPPNTLTAAGLARNGQGTVKMEWRDVTFSSNPAWIPVDWQPAPDAQAQWSNTLPSSNYCHTFQVRSTYSGFTSQTFTYNGTTSGHCQETARVIWIQPQTTAGWGTPGALIVAGEARGAPAGTTVTMYWRNLSTGGPWVKAPYSAPTDANGIWIHDIPNANYSQRYAAYVKYDAITSSTCTYAGANNITWC